MPSHGTRPRYLLRDRDRIYGISFRQRVQHMGIEEVVIAPRSPWQNPFVERLIGSIRRECLDHVVVFLMSATSSVSWLATWRITIAGEPIFRWPWIVQSRALSCLLHVEG